MPFVVPSEGGCQCGEIRYRLVGEPVWLAVCHCGNCKRQSGGTFGMSLRMHKADVKLIKGEPKCWTGVSDNGNPKSLQASPTSVPEAISAGSAEIVLERQTWNA